MNILYIWDADYPWDIRVEKICSTLSDHGHKVHIASRNLKKLPEIEISSGLVIHRLKAWRNDRMNYILSFPAFFSPIWGGFLDRIIRENNVDLVIVRDLPMAIAGIWAGRKHGIPVIFDMAEDYVAMIWDIWRARKFQGLNFLVRNPYLARIVERYVFRNADHILVVIDEARDLVIKKGVIPENITIVSNTPPLEAFSEAESNGNEAIQKIRKHYSIIYTGGVQMGRGIQTVLDALSLLVKKIPDVLFVVVGDGYAVQELKERAKRNNVQDHVLWVGWVSHEMIYEYCRASKIGVIPHLVTDHVNTTIPNKIFDYMGLGLPVIASNAAPMQRILEQEKCGMTFQSGDYEDLAHKISEIFISSYDFGNNGKISVRERYNWSIDKARLLGVTDKHDIKHDIKDKEHIAPKIREIM